MCYAWHAYLFYVRFCLYESTGDHFLFTFCEFNGVLVAFQNQIQLAVICKPKFARPCNSIWIKGTEQEQLSIKTYGSLVWHVNSSRLLGSLEPGSKIISTPCPSSPSPSNGIIHRDKSLNNNQIISWIILNPFKDDKKAFMRSYVFFYGRHFSP